MKAIRLIAWVAVAVAAISAYLSFNSGGNKTSTSGPGGPFVLTAHTGEKVSSTSFEGKYQLIYFGYTFCPDVCPAELYKLTTALNLLEEEGYDTSPLQPIFISVDPERDTVSEIANYMEDFHPSMVGFTGTTEEIQKVAKQYRVYYAKREQEGYDGYLMDHQSYVFVMNKDGSYNRLFSSQTKPQEIADTFKPVLDKKA